MKMSKGVEWAVHAAALMAVLPEGAGLSSEALARYHDVPPAYMAKQLQALSRAGLVVAERGARGGYRLSRPGAEISLLDLWLAVEGTGPAFRCSEIRQNGPCGLSQAECPKACPIAAAFLEAETVFRAHLAKTTLADIAVSVGRDMSAEHARDVFAWINAERVDRKA